MVGWWCWLPSCEYVVSRASLVRVELGFHVHPRATSHNGPFLTSVCLAITRSHVCFSDSTVRSLLADPGPTAPPLVVVRGGWGAPVVVVIVVPAALPAPPPSAWFDPAGSMALDSAARWSTDHRSTDIGSTARASSKALTVHVSAIDLRPCRQERPATSATTRGPTAPERDPPSPPPAVTDAPTASAVAPASAAVAPAVASAVASAVATPSTPSPSPSPSPSATSLFASSFVAKVVPLAPKIGESGELTSTEPTLAEFRRSA